MFVSEIFEDEPMQWGLRGDPMFWRFLKEFYRDVRAPYPPLNLRADIIYQFEKLSGFAPKTGEYRFAKEFAKKHVGMSTGMLDSDFWLDRALPLLTARLEELNKKSFE